MLANTEQGPGAHLRKRTYQFEFKIRFSAGAFTARNVKGPDRHGDARAVTL